MDFFLLIYMYSECKVTIESKYPMFHVHVHSTCMYIDLSHFSTFGHARLQNFNMFYPDLSSQTCTCWIFMK